MLARIIIDEVFPNERLHRIDRILPLIDVLNILLRSAVKLIEVRLSKPLEPSPLGKNASGIFDIFKLQVLPDRFAFEALSHLEPRPARAVVSAHDLIDELSSLPPDLLDGVLVVDAQLGIGVDGSLAIFKADGPSHDKQDANQERHDKEAAVEVYLVVFHRREANETGQNTKEAGIEAELGDNVAANRLAITDRKDFIQV